MYNINSVLIIRVAFTPIYRGDLNPCANVVGQLISFYQLLQMDKNPLDIQPPRSQIII